VPQENFALKIYTFLLTYPGGKIDCQKKGKWIFASIYDLDKNLLKCKLKYFIIHSVKKYV